MRFLLLALFAPRAHLLQHPDLVSICWIARWARRVAATLCVAMFSLMLGTVISYRAIAFELVPIFVLATLFGFVLAAMLASRFGRLCSSEKDVEHQRNIRYLCETHPQCLDYYEHVKNSHRPFTRIDLDELEAIAHRAS